MKKILLSLCALSFASCSANAAFYAKGYLGNTLSSVDYEHNIETFTPTLSGT